MRSPFRPCRLPDTCPPFLLGSAGAFIAHAVGIVQFGVGRRLRLGCVQRTPRSARPLRLIRNYRLESNPVRHDLTPLAAAIGNWIVDLDTQNSEVEAL